MASKLQLEVGYVISSQEEQALTIHISGLPQGMANPGFIKMSIEHYLMKAEIKTKSCDIVNEVAYVTLEDPSSMSLKWSVSDSPIFLFDPQGFRVSLHIHLKGHSWLMSLFIILPLPCLRCLVAAVPRQSQWYSRILNLQRLRAIPTSNLPVQVHRSLQLLHSSTYKQVVGGSKNKFLAMFPCSSSSLIPWPPWDTPWCLPTRTRDTQTSRACFKETRHHHPLHLRTGTQTLREALWECFHHHRT